MPATKDILIREARERDVEAICSLFASAYGKDYAFPQFFDPNYLKRLIFNDDCLILVAEERGGGALLGTGSVVYDVGAFTDLVAEFGRLVVHPDGRGLGIGNRLMEDRLRRVADYLHVGLADNRVAHPFSQKISLRHGFAPVGYLPIHNGEPVALFARYFNVGLDLRRRRPHLVSDLHWLAQAAMENVGLECDAVVDEAATAYPAEETFELEEMTGPAYATLLAFERGRLCHREIFGPVKLHFGKRALQRRHARYLLAKRGSEIVGAIGYARDTNVDDAVHIFELFGADEQPMRFLLSHLVQRSRDEWQADYIETDVSADAPRMQQTLLELGFLPTAYVPSAVMNDTERLDTLRMTKFFIPVSGASPALVDEVRPIADGVSSRFGRQWLEPLLEQYLPAIPIFSSLNREQRAQVAKLFQPVRFDSGEWLMRSDADEGKAYLILSGTAESVSSREETPTYLRPGAFPGGAALLKAYPHDAEVRALEGVDGARIERCDVLNLIRNRSDIGQALHRDQVPST